MLHCLPGNVNNAPRNVTESALISDVTLSVTRVTRAEERYHNVMNSHCDCRAGQGYSIQ